MNFDFTKHNIGNIDRLVRAALGVMLIVGVFFGTHWIVSSSRSLEKLNLINVL